LLATCRTGSQQLLSIYVLASSPCGACPIVASHRNYFREHGGRIRISCCAMVLRLIVGPRGLHRLGFACGVADMGRHCVQSALQVVQPRMGVSVNS
jgi:hypothetical protein